jgi:hypothetical protein
MHWLNAPGAGAATCTGRGSGRHCWTPGEAQAHSINGMSSAVGAQVRNFLVVSMLGNLHLCVVFGRGDGLGRGARGLVRIPFGLHAGSTNVVCVSEDKRYQYACADPSPW